MQTADPLATALRQVSVALDLIADRLEQQAALPPSLPARALTLAQAAERAGVSSKHLRRAIGRGDVRSFRLGRRLLIAEAELTRVLSEGVT